MRCWKTLTITEHVQNMNQTKPEMLILRDDFSQYEKNVYKLSSLARDKSTVRWHDIIRHLYEKAFVNDDHYDLWLVHVWDLSYLVYIYRLLQDAYNARAIVNYVGWTVVQHFGVLTFRSFFEGYEKTVYGYHQSGEAADVCAQLMVVLSPDQSARFVYNPLTDAPPSLFVRRIVQELETAFLLQAAQIPWMDDETRHRAQTKITSLTVSFFHEHMVQEEVEAKSTCVGTLKALYMAKAMRERAQLKTGRVSLDADLLTMSPFTPDIIYLMRSNSLVIPGLLVHNASEISSLPPIYAFSTIGAIIAVRMMEVIMFEGSYINEDLYYEDWYSVWSRENFEGLLGCFIENMKLFSPYDELMRVDFSKILKEIVLMSGAATLTYKAYLMFMGKYEEEFTKSNLKGMKITLNQYFFIHFSLNFCESTTSPYYINFNVSDISKQLRLQLRSEQCTP